MARDAGMGGEQQVTHLLSDEENAGVDVLGAMVKAQDATEMEVFCLGVINKQRAAIKELTSLLAKRNIALTWAQMSLSKGDIPAAMHILQEAFDEEAAAVVVVDVTGG